MSDKRYVSIIPGLDFLAAFWSYATNHSIIWAILHFLIGPIYLAYRIAKFLPR
jgi:hypothetical protein